MRKTVLAALLAVLASAAHAGWLDVTAHAGYTTVNMADLNGGNAELWGWYISGGEQTPVSSGYVVGLDVTTKHLSPWSWLSVGLRGEYLQTNEGITHIDDPSAYYVTDQGNLSSVLAGFQSTAPFLADGLSAGLGAWVGYGYATLTQTNPLNDGTLVQAGLYRAGLVEEQLEGTLSYQLTKRLSLGATAGWRWADAGPMKDANGQALCNNIQVYEFSNYAPLNIDFSGATARGALTYSF